MPKIIGYDNICTIAAKYDAHVDSSINEVSNDSKFKDQAEPRSGPTFVMKLKQFFKTLWYVYYITY